jgi:biopolymer transport protein ExbD
MNFRKSRGEEPEINLIPFIDVLLVVLIFLMLSTTYSKFTELQVKLPVADTEAQKDYPKEVVVSVGSNGSYAVNKTLVGSKGVDALTLALREVAGGQRDTVVIISADAHAAHQSVISVMEAARRAGLSHITFASQNSTGS